MINLKVRLKNPLFIVQIFMAVLMPILAYMGLTFEDMTSWSVLGDALLHAISNPYIIGIVIVSVFNAVNDPTTHGISDSENAMHYKTPK